MAAARIDGGESFLLLLRDGAFCIYAERRGVLNWPSMRVLTGCPFGEITRLQLCVEMVHWGVFSYSLVLSRGFRLFSTSSWLHF